MDAGAVCISPSSSGLMQRRFSAEASAVFHYIFGDARETLRG
jgi:hypothetical protein